MRAFVVQILEVEKEGRLGVQVEHLFNVSVDERPVRPSLIKGVMNNLFRILVGAGLIGRLQGAGIQPLELFVQPPFIRDNKPHVLNNLRKGCNDGRRRRRKDRLDGIFPLGNERERGFVRSADQVGKIG